jgi:hypothetical protein
MKFKIERGEVLKKIRFVLFAVCLTALPLFGQWQADYRLTNDPNESRCATTKAVAANGPAVHVVWFDNRDGNQEIYYKSSSDTGLTWSADDRLTNNASSSQTPRIVVSGANLHVVWQDNRDGNYEVYYKRSTDAGAGWGSDIRLTSNSNWSLFPTLAVSGSSVHLLWMDDRDGNRETYYKHSTDNGASWSSDTRLSNDADWTWSPAIAVAGDTVHAVWYESDAGGNLGKEIWYARSTNAGLTWEPAINLTSDPGVSMGPCVGASGSTVHVTWEDNRDGNYEIYYKRSTDNGASWGSDTRLTSNSAASTGSSIDISGANVHVVWTDERDANSEIYYKSSVNNGASWSPDTRLTNDAATSFYNSISASGPAVNVVWYDQRDGNWEVYYKRNPTGNVFIEEQQSRILPRNPLSAATMFRDRIIIRFTMPSQNPLKLKLYDITGTLVFEENYVRPVSTLILQGGKIRGLTRGVYFLNIASDKGEIAGVKLIKL